MGFWYNGFDIAFGAIGIMVTTAFVLAIGVIIVVLVKGISTWNKNNNSPRLTVEAEVVSKRIDISHHNHAFAEGHNMGSTTWYYVAFQVESGDRIEFSVTGSEYNMLVEKDKGKLSFQGTRYLSFERI